MRELSVAALAEWLQDSDRALTVLDVREPWEINTCALEHARHIPLREVPARIEELQPQGAIAVICHHGVRSAMAARFLEQSGFSEVYNVSGGIDRWAKDIDPTMPTY